MTTQGNAMDARPGPRDALLERLAGYASLRTPGNRATEVAALLAEGLAEEVRRHRDGSCATCGYYNYDDREAACPFVLRWATRLGAGAPEPAKRYDQCDDTCTADCGHCKGAGRPAVAASPHAEGEPRKCPTCGVETDADGRSFWHDEDVHALALHDARLAAEDAEGAPPASPETPVPGEGVAGRG